MPASGPVRYLSADEDSARWLGFAFRPDDIVISTRSKHGTTWVQNMVAMLVFGRPDLPAPMAELSPWLDFKVEAREAVLARLAGQTHRRFIKTHTPLDGVPQAPGVTYIVVARHPLDAAVSLWHQGENLDRARMAALIGDRPPSPAERVPLRTWLRGWVEADADPREHLDSLAGVLHHLKDAWARREDNAVVLVHYADLQSDLAAEMRRLADRLDVTVPGGRWPALLDAARFTAMRRRAGELAPNHNGVLRDPAAFFRRGASGAAAEVLDPADLAAYTARAQTLASPDLLAWLNRG